jgi:hypothetical protein
VIRFSLPLPSCISALLLASIGLALAQGLAAQTVPATECFPFERLNESDRQQADEWLMTVLDQEGLYSLADNQKAATLAFVAARVDVVSPSTEELDKLARAHRILQHFRCGGDFAATTIAGTVVFEGKRVVHGVVFRRERIPEVIAANPEVYGAAALEPGMPAEQVLATVELMQPPLRHRVWGHLLGYPGYAVEFFAQADQQQRESGDNSRAGIVPRDFYSVPTFKRETNHFVWAVPKGHQENDADRAIRDRAAATLARYRAIREQMSSHGNPDAVGLVRALLCKDDSSCIAGSTPQPRH